MRISAERQSAIELTPCDFAKPIEAALCAKHEVYENRAAQSGRRISLSIVVLPARSSEAKSDPVFYLAGGPGQAAARIASAGEDAIMRALRRERDLVFVDMRGTGDSNGLQCRFPGDRTKLQTFFAELFDPGAVQACREALEQSADLRFYLTSQATQDLEDIRAAFGYDRINLYGISNGTLAALEYLRRYPRSVRAAVLAGVATPAAKMPLQFARGAQQAMTRLFRDCAADQACATAFPALAGKFAKLMAAFKTGFVTFDAPHPASKEMQSVTLSRGVFARQLALLLNSPGAASLLPFLISSAAHGNWAPFVQILTRSTTPAQFTVFLGPYFSALCTETLPFIDEDSLKQVAAGTFIGDYLIRRHQQACAHWPRGEVAPEFNQPVRALTPVLMLSGDIDPATPPEFGAQALQALPNGRQVILRNTPHSYNAPCAAELIAAFIAFGGSRELNVNCAARLRRPPFATELPASYNR